MPVEPLMSASGVVNFVSRACRAVELILPSKPRVNFAYRADGGRQSITRLKCAAVNVKAVLFARGNRVHAVGVRVRINSADVQKIVSVKTFEFADANMSRESRRRIIVADTDVAKSRKQIVAAEVDIGFASAKTALKVKAVGIHLAQEQLAREIFRLAVAVRAVGQTAVVFALAAVEHGRDNEQTAVGIFGGTGINA